MKGNILNFTAEEAIPAFRFVKAGTADGNVKLAGAGDAVLGVTTDVDAAAGNRQDVQLDGIAQISAGASVTFGNRLKSNADGKAVPATEGDDTYGVALDSGAANDIIRIALGFKGSIPVPSKSDEI